MTVIAWDGKSLAADRQATAGNTKFATTKLRVIRDHLTAGTGDEDMVVEMRAWFAAGAKPEEFPASCRHTDGPGILVTITPNRKVQVYQRSPHPMVFDGPYYAAGSGRDFALAAMHLGRTALEACEVACALDSTCGLGVDVLTLDAPAYTLPAASTHADYAGVLERVASERMHG